MPGARIDGEDVQDAKQYAAFWEVRTPTAGDPVLLTIERQQKEMNVLTQFSVSGYDLFHQLDESGELNRRRSGFPAVFAHDGVISPEQCGGPVVDLQGRIVGVNISRAGRHAAYAIPTSVILKLVQQRRDQMPRVGNES